jgi:hypothetical protein
MRSREFTGSYFVTVNRVLNPKIWQGTELDPAVEAKLLKIAEKFQEFLNVDLDVIDYTLTGSNANYTWTKFSDIDLHVLVNGEVSEEYRELFNAKKALWAEHHDIKIKGIPVECYVQGSAEPHHSTGIYSVMKNKWLEQPKKSKPAVDDGNVQRKLESVTHDVAAAIASGNLKKIAAAKERITTMRKAGLERAGEWSVENLVFKQLRNIGIIDQLTDKIRDLEDRELSLESRNLT